MDSDHVKAAMTTNNILGSHILLIVSIIKRNVEIKTFAYA